MEHFRGDIFALATALCWSVAVIFFKLSSDRVPIGPLKILQNLIAVALFLVTIVLWREPLWINLDGREWMLLSVSALVGISLGDTLYIAAIKRIGPSYQALVDILYLPMVVVLAYWFFGETLPPQTLVGGAIVLFAIFFAHRDPLQSAIKKPQLLVGVIYAILAQLSMALCVILVRDILRKESVLTITAYRFLIGTLLLILYYWIKGVRFESFNPFFKRGNRSVALAGTFLGPYLSTLFWFAGFKYTLAGRAAIYNQLSTVFILLLARFFLGEALSRHRAIAIFVALAGALLVWSS